ncbi:1,4-alpha-glucan branching protein [Microbispora sp. NEAU-D428]|uniref:maltokinase N-terminal cap-like domain-containing protein n=1 Tax=Microbispora sitophila TaxID=2771537 RepID=UPI0018661B2C|nr:1,4-alpha-glucan branching protein [Microbispora sitophila]MBE3012006.1 1,4-alpha-glucan branching protein [Microbispora sitophila]
MAVIHRTTLTPSKLELLTTWLPVQPWYEGEGRPELAKAGGFRLDDPQGEVGIEFMVVTDVSGEGPVSYQVPFSYRGAPLEGADHALIGTTEHGVLGRRWIYDGTHDPVLVAQLHALFQGEAEAQDQNVSDTPDPSVIRSFTGAAVPGPIRLTAVADAPHATDIVVDAATVDDAGDGGRGGRLTMRVTRVLRPGEADVADALGHVTAGWRLPDGAEVRGVFAVITDTPR